MSSFFQTKKIIVDVKYTDASKKGRYFTSNSKNSVDTSVTGTFFLGNSANLNDYKMFFAIDDTTLCSTKKIKIDALLINEYLMKVEKYLERFDKFVEKTSVKRPLLNQLSGDELLNVKLRLNDTRVFLSIPKDNEVNKIFTSCLYGTVTNIIFEEVDASTLRAYPVLKDNFYKLFIDVLLIDEAFLKKELAAFYNKYNSDGYRLFGLIYGVCAERNGINISSKNFVNEAAAYNINLKESFYVEINKGAHLGKHIKNIIVDEMTFDYCPSDDSENNNFEYYKFKNLVSWFVKQLNINNDIISGEHHSGQGYSGDSIRELYKDWRDYGNFTLDCNLQSGYNSSSSGANYINRTGTGINIKPSFAKEDKSVTGLYLDVYKTEINPAFKARVDELLTDIYLIDTLELDGEEVSNSLKKLFDNYVELIDLLTNVIPATGAYNKVFYGAPGCGKSYFVKNELLPNELHILEDNVIRTTFYQDYSNTDFVGQVLPKITGKDVTYEFNPGPFTLALVKALKNVDKPVALVIEELNRGSAASIFGDIFQLLDRKADGSSEYEIQNTNIQDYLKKEGLEVKSISIPANLYIIATMNTSDQNVFTLDTAFKRRWKFEKIKNSFDGHKYKDWLVPGMEDVTWEDMVMSINEYIVANADQFMNEDKQIGVYFIDETGLVEKKIDVTEEKIKEFSYKLLEYLWDDVAKFTDKNKWFKDSRTLDELLDNYMKAGKAAFSESLISVIKKQQDSKKAKSQGEESNEHED